VKEYKSLYIEGTIGDFESCMSDFERELNKLAHEGWVFKFSNTTVIPAERISNGYFCLIGTRKTVVALNSLSK
jgi:hypothetical protein